MIVKIQNRRGQYIDFDPSKLLPGEFAIVQTGDPNTADGKAIYIGVTAGNVKQLATLDELQSEVETALQSAIPEVVEEATQEAQDAADRAEAAAEHLVTDTTLTVAGRAADAKSTGDEISELNERIDNIRPGLSDDAKEALLACFNHVLLWDDADSASYISALQNALYPTEYPQIVATFTPGTHVVYSTDQLSSLRNYLTVVYYETEESEGVTVTNYSLTGELTGGTNYITVSYDGLSTRFSVNVVDVDNIMEWNYPSDITDLQMGTVERISTQDIRAVINTSVTSRRVIGNTLTSPKIMDRNLTTLAIAPIQLPEGTTGATVTFSATGIGNIKYLFARVRKTDDYYNIITWTAQANSGERTSFSMSNQLVLLTIVSDNTVTSVSNVKIVFDKNA